MDREIEKNTRLEEMKKMIGFAIDTLFNKIKFDDDLFRGLNDQETEEQKEKYTNDAEKCRIDNLKVIITLYSRMGISKDMIKGYIEEYLGKKEIDNDTINKIMNGIK